jgi:hypothetical protein
LPAWCKVVLSASLIFPMYYWIAFPIYEIETKKKTTRKSKKSLTHEVHIEQNMNMVEEDECDEDEDDNDHDQDTKAELNKKLLSEITKTRKHSKLLLNKKDHNLSKAAKTVACNFDLKETHTKESNRKRTKYVTPPFYRKIYMLWSSPFTKFWANFISYICFLALFGIVTLWPCCGK